jgi:hypothetical protein
MTYEEARSSCLERDFLVQGPDYQTSPTPAVAITILDVSASSS